MITTGAMYSVPSMAMLHLPSARFMSSSVRASRELTNWAPKYDARLAIAPRVLVTIHGSIACNESPPYGGAGQNWFQEV